MHHDVGIEPQRHLLFDRLGFLRAALATQPTQSLRTHGLRILPEFFGQRRVVGIAQSSSVNGGILLRSRALDVLARHAARLLPAAWTSCLRAIVAVAHTCPSPC